MTRPNNEFRPLPYGGAPCLFMPVARSSDSRPNNRAANAAPVGRTRPLAHPGLNRCVDIGLVSVGVLTAIALRLHPRAQLGQRKRNLKRVDRTITHLMDPTGGHLDEERGPRNVLPQGGSKHVDPAPEARRL
jgi:hypothetical protein